MSNQRASSSSSPTRPLVERLIRWPAYIACAVLSAPMLLTVGFIGIATLNGMRAAMASAAHKLSSNYMQRIILLFVLMGNTAAKSRMSRKLYDVAYDWIEHWRDVLASAAVVGCAGFAAVSGSSITTAITMGRVALPETKRAK